MELSQNSSPNHLPRKKRSDKSLRKDRRKRERTTSEHAPPHPKKQRNHEYSEDAEPKHHSHDSSTELGPSPFHLRTYSIYLTISPIGQQQPIQTLCAEHLSPLLLTYYPPFHGVVISYKNPRLSSSPQNPSTTDGRKKVFARSVDEYAATFVWLTAEFLIMNPQKGDVCEGYVSLQNEANIALVCWNFFSATIERKRLPRDWRWVSGNHSFGSRKQKLKKIPSEDDMDLDESPKVSSNATPMFEELGDYFVNAKGKRVSGVIRFKVRDVDTSSSTSRDFDFFSIIGTMLDDKEEEALKERESSLAVSSSKSNLQESSAVNGYDGANDIEGSRHRIKY